MTTRGLSQQGGSEIQSLGDWGRNAERLRGEKQESGARLQEEKVAEYQLSMLLSQ